jgi:predicted urease superfamily metal-dependent hydrolase
VSTTVSASKRSKNSCTYDVATAITKARKNTLRGIIFSLSRLLPLHFGVDRYEVNRLKKVCGDLMVLALDVGTPTQLHRPDALWDASPQRDPLPLGYHVPFRRNKGSEADA